jgi:rubredoxin
MIDKPIYTCSACGLTFKGTRSDKEAKAEAEVEFPEMIGEPHNVVCDGCYNEFMAWHNR